MKPNCTKCKHFFITYEKSTPRGCRIYQIKSAQLPCLIVKSANNGADCIGFELKDTKGPKQKDLNDSRYW